MNTNDIQKFKEISRLYINKTEIEAFLRESPSELAKTDADSNKDISKLLPTRPRQIDSDITNKSSMKIAIVIPVAILVVVPLIIGIVSKGSFIVNFFGSFIGILLLIVICGVPKDIINGFKKAKEESEYANKYSRLLKEYNEKKNIYDRKYQDFYNEKLKEYNEIFEKSNKYLSDINRELDKYRNFLPEVYWKNADKLVEIFESKRADELKEALNILSSDLQNEQILNESRRKNDLLQQQLEEQIKHNEEMERLEEERMIKEERDRFNERVEHDKAMKDYTYYRKKAERHSNDVFSDYYRDKADESFIKSMRK